MKEKNRQEYEGPKINLECGEYEAEGNTCVHGPFKCGKKPCHAEVEYPTGGYHAQPAFPKTKKARSH